MPDAKRNAAIYYIEDGFDPKKGLNGRRIVESYSGGEFFEPNFLDTNDVILKRYFPNMITPVGGVGFEVIAQACAD